MLTSTVLFNHSHITLLFGKVTEAGCRGKSSHLDHRAMPRSIPGKWRLTVLWIHSDKNESAFISTLTSSLIYASLTPTIGMVIFISFIDFSPMAIKTKLHWKINIKFIIWEINCQWSYITNEQSCEYVTLLGSQPLWYPRTEFPSSLEPPPLLLHLLPLSCRTFRHEPYSFKYACIPSFPEITQSSG